MKTYPFSAIVGHDQLRLALILCAVRPEIGGVLIRGEKGTAKSTAVRGLAALLSAASDPAGADARLVELPIGATEDRVIGSLDLQRVLRDGEHAEGAGRLRLRPGDVRRAVREGREGNLVIFVVDASGSMAARDRMAAVSGATLSLLRDAYQRRDKVAVITFRAREARLLLPPTTSAHIAARRLSRFDTGGQTPLAEGLLAARELVVREKVRDRARRPLVVVLTDGRANAGRDPLGRSRSAAALLVAEGAAAVVVDCEISYVRLGLAQQLATQLGAHHAVL